MGMRAPQQPQQAPQGQTQQDQGGSTFTNTVKAVFTGLLKLQQDLESDPALPPELSQAMANVRVQYENTIKQLAQTAQAPQQGQQPAPQPAKPRAKSRRRSAPRSRCRPPPGNQPDGGLRRSSTVGVTGHRAPGTAQRSLLGSRQRRRPHSPPPAGIGRGVGLGGRDRRPRPSRSRSRARGDGSDTS